MDKEQQLRALFDGTGAVPDDVARCKAVPACNGEGKAFVHDLNKPNDASRKARARIAIVGEAPGSQENKKGLPFVGPSGNAIETELDAIDVDRNDVYFTNSVKCWPTDDGKTRPPTGAEIGACLPVVKQELSILQPVVVIAMGGPSIKALLGNSSVQGAIKHGPVKALGMTIIPTYHPAAMMHSPSQRASIKAELEKAFVAAKALLEQKSARQASLLDF